MFIMSEGNTRSKLAGNWGAAGRNWASRLGRKSYPGINKDSVPWLCSRHSLAPDSHCLLTLTLPHSCKEKFLSLQKRRLSEFLLIIHLASGWTTRVKSQNVPSRANLDSVINPESSSSLGEGPHDLIHDLQIIDNVPL